VIAPIFDEILEKAERRSLRFDLTDCFAHGLDLRLELLDVLVDVWQPVGQGDLCLVRRRGRDSRMTVIAPSVKGMAALIFTPHMPHPFPTFTFIRQSAELPEPS
jgi:hypothetical protein